MRSTSLGSRPLRILHLVENLERGGLERTVIDLVAAQRQDGHECRVTCLFERGALADELTASGVVVEACGKRSGADLPALRRLRQSLRWASGGIVHTHNATAHYHAALAALGIPLRRLVNTRHGMGEGNPRSRREWLYRRSMATTDRVVAVCQAARQRFEASGVRPRHGVLSIPNGIRVDGFAAASPQARLALCEAMGLPAGTRLVGTVGRLQPVKDQANLIRAFTRVHARLPDTALLLIGDGPLRGALEQVAAEQGIAASVRFLGDRGDVPALLQGLEVFALSSLSEGYSIALLEACAAALPIVATQVGGNGEIVRDTFNGRLVPAQDADRLADALQALLCAPLQAEAMGLAGRQWVMGEGSFRTMAARYEAVYREGGVA